METDADTPPPELSHAGAVIDKAIEYLIHQNIDQISIASALLGGSLGLLARSMDDASIVRVLQNAIVSVQTGDLQRPDIIPPES